MRLFISYRRDDTASAAGRSYDRLCRVLRPDDVFFDVSAIKGGEDFEERIERAINDSDAALIFIGDKWVEPAAPGDTARIWKADDYVRTEVRTALAKLKLVIPVLVARARMPSPAQLPDDIRGITTRNALPLRHESFDDDMENIVAAIFGKSGKQRAWEAPSFWSQLAYGVMGSVVGLCVVLVIAIIHYQLLSRSLAETIGTPLTILLMIAGGVCGLWTGLRFRAARARRA
jgi:hypothetical protein